MLRAVKVRIYPNAAQDSLLRQHVGHSRAIFNMGLAWCIWQYHAAMAEGEKPKSPSHFTLTKWLTDFKKSPELPWLETPDVPRDILVMSLERLARAYKNFFQGRARDVGFPKFKGRYGTQSARYSRGVKVTPCGRFVSVPPRHFGWMRMRGWRAEFDGGTIKTCTVAWTPAARWTLSLLVDDGQPEAIPLPIDGRVVGIDLGLKDIATLYDGVTFEKVGNPRHLLRACENLVRKQRKHSRKLEAAKRHKGGEGKRRERSRILEARAHERVANARADRNAKLAHYISRDAAVVVFENLGVKNMMQNKKLSKHIGDAAWGDLVRRVDDKMKERGGRVVKVARNFASSQICSACGYRGGKLGLEIRAWTCPECGANHDRDENAAKNIRIEGLRLLSAETVESK